MNSSPFYPRKGGRLRASEDAGCSPEHHDLRNLLLDVLQQLQQTRETLEKMASAFIESRTNEAAKTKPILTVREVAELMCRSEYTIRRWIRQRKLKADRIQGTGPRGQLLIRRESLLELVERGLAEDLPPAAL